MGALAHHRLCESEVRPWLNTIAWDDPRAMQSMFGFTYTWKKRPPGASFREWPRKHGFSIGLMHNGSNNGAIAISTRELGKRIGASHVAAATAILELENGGFLRCVKASSFSQKRLAAEYRLTHLRCDVTGQTATKEYCRSRDAEKNVVQFPKVAE